MSDLTVRLDMDRVQSSVQAKIRPAVEAELEKLDIQAMIQAALAKEVAAEDTPFGRFSSMFCFDHEQRTSSLIERMIASGIRNIAKEFVESALRAQQPFLHDAFMEMMQKNENGLVRAFVAAMTDSLNNGDWSFDVDFDVKGEITRVYDD